MAAGLILTRQQVLSFRRVVQALDHRLPPGTRPLRHAAWAGLQDSMPRAALLSIHARVAGTTPTAWEAPALVQVWGPRYSVYVVAARDASVFTVGRMPDGGSTRRVAEDLAARLTASLDGEPTGHAQAGRALGEPPNRLRYATLTGTVRLRWDGARQPTIWTVPLPDIDPREARLELARRYLHVWGPTTPDAFAGWAGVPATAGVAAFDALRPSLIPVRTPLGDAWMLASDERTARAASADPAPARLLPSGDTYYLLQGAERTLLVENARHRAALWTSRVWPGALLVRGEIAGIWRRSHGVVSIETWRRLSPSDRGAIEAEVARLPIPGMDSAMTTRWTD